MNQSNASKFIIIFLLTFSNLLFTTNNSVIFLRNVDSITINPYKTWDFASSEVLYHIFEGLVTYDYKKINILPSLAYKWESNEKKDKWIFYLRKGIRFHNNEELDADLVVKNFKFKMNYKSTKLKYLTSLIKDVIKRDKYTIEFDLNTGSIDFLYTLTNISMFIFPSNMLKMNFKNIYGTGPFKFLKWEKNKELVLVANKNYWRKKIRINKIIFRKNKSSKWKILQLKNGDCDLTELSSLEEVMEVRNIKNIDIKKKLGFNIKYIILNTKKEPFKNINARRLIYNLLNRLPLKRYFFQDIGISAKTFIPYYFLKNEEIKIKYFKNIKFPKKKYTLIKAFVNNKMAHEIAILKNLSKRLKKYNYKMDLREISFKEFANVLDNKEYDMAVVGWIADYPSFYSYYYPIFTKNKLNRSFFYDKNLIKLIENLRFSKDNKDIIKKCLKIEKIITKKIPIIPLYHLNYIIGAKKSLKGIKLSPFHYLNLTDSYWENENEKK